MAAVSHLDTGFELRAEVEQANAGQRMGDAAMKENTLPGVDLDSQCLFEVLRHEKSEMALSMTVLIPRYSTEA